MNTAQLIISTLAFTQFPIAQSSYAGSDESYIVFRLDDYPDDFGNDSPGHIVVDATIHLFAPFSMNTRKLRKQICRALHEAGFTYPHIVDASESVRSSDGTEQHLVFECEIAEGIEDA